MERRKADGSAASAVAGTAELDQRSPGQKIQRPKLAIAAGTIARETTAEMTTESPSAGPRTRKKSRFAIARLAALPPTVSAATRMIGVYLAVASCDATLGRSPFASSLL